MSTQSSLSIPAVERLGESNFWRSKLRYVTVAAILAIGMLRIWIGRFSMSPDGICYLDMGDAFFQRRWSTFVNGYWSPLYSWFLGLALFLARPSRWHEFPVAHLVVLTVYVAALFSFEFFLRSLSFHLEQAGDESANRPKAVYQRSLFFLGYALFLWSSLELITVWDISPDLLVSVFVYIIAGLLLRLKGRHSVGLYAAFGITLGAAYLAKAVMFPVAILCLLIGFASARRQYRLWFLLVASLAFVVTSSPWFISLSHAKGRPDFGDTGWINYSSFVSPGGRALNWQGEPSASGRPVHSTRQIHDHPPVFEFATPVGGTYPPSYDPSYWNEGRRWTFDLRSQLSVLKTSALFYAGLFLRDQPGVLAAALALILACGSVARQRILAYWPLLAISLAPMALYALVHTENRFVGAQIVVFWIVIFTAVSAADVGGHPNLTNYLLLATAVTILLSVADGTLRSIQMHGPYSSRDHIVIADQLERAGLHSGDPIAVLGDGNWSYWARLAKLKIVSTIMSHDLAEFWRLSSDRKREVYRLFAGTGARALIAVEPLSTPDPADGWQQIGSSGCYLLWLSRY